MELSDQANTPFFSGTIMQVILKYRKHLIVIGIIAILASVIFSAPFFIKPLYKSTVILYPTASNSISKALLSENRGNTKDILEFGEDEQTEQMLQVLNSNKIRDRIIAKYNLLDHYGIEKNSKYKMTNLFKQYEDNFNFRRTEYMAVKISVYDEDPQLAADMANDVGELVDSTINSMQKEIARKAFRIVEKEYLSLKKEVEVKEDSLTILRGLGVHDYESQSEMFNRQLAIEMAQGNSSGVKRLEQKLEILAKYGGPYVSIRDALEHDKKLLSELKAKYEEAKVDATENLPHKFVVSSAYKAERKSYPIRWLIVIITTFSALFLALLIFGLIEVFADNLLIISKKKRTDQKSLGSIFTYLKSEYSLIRHKTEEIKAVEATELKRTSAGKKRIADKKKIEINQRDNFITQMENYFKSANLINVIDKWKIHLLVIVLIAALAAAIFSGPAFITPLFKSYAVAYPANVEPYSEESETEQMLQILNSQDIKDSVIQMFDLPRHYEIDTKYKYFKTVLLYEYNQNVSISKTPYESVQIEVLDKDPDTAAMMVSAIIDFYNKKVGYLHKSKYLEVINMYEFQLQMKRNTLDSLKNLMIELGTKHGIIEYEFQSQEIMRGYLKTIYGSNSSQINSKEVDRLFTSMQNYGGQLVEIVKMIENEAISYVDIKEDYEMTWRFINSDLTYANIITSPFPADKKTYPVRWLVVVVVSLAAFILATLVVFIIESRKKQS
jgi:capsular polysaccharide biosynthesis protein